MGEVMDSENNAYGALNKRWKAACRLVLGGEIGELEEFSEWLSELNEPGFHAKSASGGDAFLPSSNYCDGATFTSLEEVDFNKKFEPLSINEVKDIDSIIEALGERFVYCGGIILGNSGFVEKSSNVTDSFYVYKSNTVGYSNYVAFSALSRFCENVFGSSLLGYSNYCIWGKYGFNNMRSLAFIRCQSSSDCYYAYNLHNCSDCLFSFNLHSKRNAVGNLELPRETYVAVKNKLLEEIREALEKNRRLPSLFEIVGKEKPRVKLNVKPQKSGKQDREGIEDAFSKATELVLQKKLEGLEKYSKWLEKNVGRISIEKSALSNERVLVGEYAISPFLPRNRLVSEEESLAAGEMRLEETEAGKVGLHNAGEVLRGIAFFPGEFHFGTNENVIECDTSGFAFNCYRTSIARDTKYAAYSWWPKDSDYIFGSRIVHDSSFCINCYDSTRLRGCFEVDGSRNCSGAYFCHNAENIQDGLFCFNAKNKARAVGNAEIEKGKYAVLKEKLLAEITDELERKGELKWDIFSIGRRESGKNGGRGEWRD